MEVERGAKASVGLYDVPYLNKSERGWLVEQYPTDSILKTVGFGSSKREPPKRGKVKEFSYRSRRRLLFCAFNACCDWQAFIGLTYPSEFPMDGRECQGHLHNFLVEVKRVHGVRHYLAAREFQDRGATHFHALVDARVPKDWLSRRWFEIVGSGDEKHQLAGTSVEQCRDRSQGAGYMAKVYGAKYQQKIPPEGFINLGRYWFASRGLVIPDRVVQLQENEFKGIKRVVRHVIEKRIGKDVAYLHDKQGAGRGVTLWRGRPIVDRLLALDEEV